MNIVLMNHYAGSPSHGMEFRPYYLAREWEKLGHSVQVLAASRSHVRSRQPELTNHRLNQEIDGVKYSWYATPSYRGNGVGRLINIAIFLLRVWLDTPRIVREFRPEIVIASSTYPLDIWVARRMARLAGAILVYEIHDLWPLSPIETAGMSKWHPFAILCQKAENFAYRSSDLVVSILPKVHEHVVAHGLSLNRLAIVSNGISPDDWVEQVVEKTSLREDLETILIDAKKAGEIVVGYAGSMGLPNALDTLLDAVPRVGAGVRFVLVGDGHERIRLQKRIGEENLTNVNILPPIKKTQIPTFLRRLDIAYIGWKHLSIYRFGIAPNKLMDYMMAECAVLQSVEAGNDPVVEAGCGLTVAPEDPDAVARGILELAALSAAERAAMGARGRAFVQANHTYPVLARQFLTEVSLRRGAKKGGHVNV